MFKADEYSVNCVQCHPNRFLIATSGIDPVIRFWEPARVKFKFKKITRFNVFFDDFTLNNFL